MLQKSNMNAHLLSQLHQALANMLRHATLKPQTLPQCPAIQLNLIDPESAQGPFSAEEIDQIEYNPAYWSLCWASGQVLAREILANPSWVQGKTIMDFGAGSGVVAIAAALAGAQKAIVCDIDSDAMLSCQANAALNQVQLHYAEDFFQFNEEIDLLIAADVLYDRNNLPLIEEFQKKAHQVMIADSRIKNFNSPGFYKMGICDSFTFPDMAESEEFNRVNLYCTEVLEWYR